MQNLLDFSRQFNWIDILICILFVRLAFVSLKAGLAVESFKILGTLSAVYVAMHYFWPLAAYLNLRSGNKTPPSPFLEEACFISLCILGYLFFWLIRVLVFRVVTTQIDLELSRWGGFVLGMGRSFLLTSIILFSLMLTKADYFKESVRFSYTGAVIVHVAPTTYAWVWDTLTSKFMFHEKFNTAVTDTLTAKTKKKKQ